MVHQKIIPGSASTTSSSIGGPSDDVERPYMVELCHLVVVNLDFRTANPEHEAEKFYCPREMNISSRCRKRDCAFSLCAYSVMCDVEDRMSTLTSSEASTIEACSPAR